MAIFGGHWDLLHGIPVFHYFSLIIKPEEIHGDIFIVARPYL